MTFIVQSEWRLLKVYCVYIDVAGYVYGDVPSFVFGDY